MVNLQLPELQNSKNEHTHSNTQIQHETPSQHLETTLSAISFFPQLKLIIIPTYSCNWFDGHLAGCHWLWLVDTRRKWTAIIASCMPESVYCCRLRWVGVAWSDTIETGSELEVEAQLSLANIYRSISDGEAASTAG